MCGLIHRVRYWASCQMWINRSNEMFHFGSSYWYDNIYSLKSHDRNYIAIKPIFFIFARSTYNIFYTYMYYILQEKQWLVSLIDTFPIIRGHCSDDEFHRFLLGLRRLVRRQFVEYKLVSVGELLDCKDGFCVNIQSKESPEAHTQNSRQSHR